MVSSVVVIAIAMSVTVAFLSWLLWHKENYLPFTSNKKKKRKKPRNGVIDAIGNTPLIRLNSLSQATGCEILGKCEFLNPGGSVKDRVVVQIIKEALESGKLAPGGVVTKGSAGSTAISLATVSSAFGCKCHVVIPDDAAIEKEQTGGALDTFVAAIGTGGTVAGVSRFLQNPKIKCFLIDPPCSGLFNKVTRGVMYTREEAEGRRLKNRFDTITEGIGINRVTQNFMKAKLDGAF
ncbi:hypothetical protein SLA2020_143740 [Shorea laevis]